MGKVRIGGQDYFLKKTATDGTAGEIQIYLDSTTQKSVGLVGFGKNITELQAVPSEGSILTLFEILDDDSGVIFATPGPETTTYPDGLHIKDGDINIPCTKGMIFRVTTAD